MPRWFIINGNKPLKFIFFKRANTFFDNRFFLITNIILIWTNRSLNSGLLNNRQAFILESYLFFFCFVLMGEPHNLGVTVVTVLDFYYIPVT